VYPPVDTDFYRPAGRLRPSAPGFLVVSALVPYKRVDVAIEACRKAGVALRVAGDGPELQRLQQLGGNDVEFVGWKSDEEIRTLYQDATAVLLPGVEDFGMVPVEAQACGTPVVALNEGGAVESVIDGSTGVLVTQGSPDALADGIRRTLGLTFDPAVLRANALRFSRQRFLTEFHAAVTGAIAEKRSALAGRVAPAGAPAVRENDR
jgi:glycosyltransferase involved in cell wall biosynthesis